MVRTMTEAVGQREGLRERLGRFKIQIAPSAANFPFIDLGRPNGPVNKALVTHAGHHRQAMARARVDTFIRVPIGTATENDRFASALERILDDESTTPING